MKGSIVSGRRAVLIILASCALCAVFSGPAHAGDYRIGSQDVLKISVYEHPELDTVVRVGQDGGITFPFIGELMVQGMDCRQIEKLVAKGLSPGYVPNPQVSVFVEQFNARKVTVIGEVNKPGRYDLAGPTTVLDAIAMALGLAPDAGGSITLLRKDPSGRYGKSSIDADELFDGDAAADARLRDKDVIYVPKAGRFYIYGQVNRPGGYRVERDLTVRRAVSVAGGFTPEAASGRIEITRRLDGKDVTAPAGLDDPVKANDTIMVKESIF